MRIGKSRPLMFCLMVGLATAVTPARADNEPVIVIPGRPGVPVYLYGRDISGAVLEGEWGLNRPGVVTPTVIGGGWPHVVYGPAGPFFPSTGRRPRSGRLEVIPPPNRRLPRPAQPYSRSWTSESAPLPATSPSDDDMPIFVSPQIGSYPGGWPRPHPGPHHRPRPRASAP
jgi:hypothetical protein